MNVKSLTLLVTVWELIIALLDMTTDEFSTVYPNKLLNTDRSNLIQIIITLPILFFRLVLTGEKRPSGLGNKM